MIHKLFTLPMKALIQIGEKVKEETDKELYDIENIKNALMQLHQLYELNQIDEDAYKEKEAELLVRYKEAKIREQHGSE